MIEYITFIEQVNLLFLLIQNTDFTSCVPFLKALASCNDFNVIFVEANQAKATATD